VATIAVRRPLFGVSRRRRRHWLTAYLFVLPAVIFFLGVRLVPIVFAAYLSFTDWDILSPTRTLVGLENYVEAVKTETFRVSLRNTAYYTLLIVCLGIPTALVLAASLDRLVRPIQIGVRWAFFLPLVTSTVAVTVVWAWVYQPTYGLLNQYLALLGVPPQAWLLDPAQVIPALAVMSIWKGVGYNMIIFFAGLQSIDPTYYEAAQIDGATRLQRFRYMTLPLLKPTTLLVFITTVIGSFQVFTQVFVMTNGGSGYASRVVSLEIYQTAFINLKMGLASAMAMVLFGVVFALTMLQLKLGRDNVDY
jgi:ABC-type sugar transport system permease subunit